MKPPRISISGLMAVVLIVALDFGFGKAIFDRPGLGMMLSELLVIGGFPMANILMIGMAVLVVGRRELGPRRDALIGFEAFGLAASLAFLTCAFLETQVTHDSVRPLIRLSGLDPGLGLVAFVGVLFLLPQVGLAMLGWWASRLEPVRRWREARKPGPADFDFERPGLKATGG